MKYTFGQILREKRKSLALSQADIAGELNVSIQTVSRWETDGGMPDISQIVPLAKILGTTTDILLGMENSEEDAVNDILEEGERLITSHGINKLTLGVENEALYYETAYKILLEKTKSYPYNSRLLLRCAEYGLVYLRYCLKRKYPITENDLSLMFKDLKRMLITVINFEGNIARVVNANRFLAELYACMGNENDAYAVASELPYRYKSFTEFKIAKITDDSEKKLEFAKKRYKDGVCDFTCSCMTLYEVYTVLGQPAREKALQVLKTALDFLETVHGTIAEEYYLQKKIIYLKRMAMEHLRDSNFEGCLDCIEDITISCIALFPITMNLYSEAITNNTFTITDEHDRKTFGETPDKNRVIDGFLWTINECYAECWDRKNNPIVNSNRFKKCIEKIKAL